MCVKEQFRVEKKLYKNYWHTHQFVF